MAEVGEPKELFDQYHRALELKHDLSIVSLLMRTAIDGTLGMPVDIDDRLATIKEKARLLPFDHAEFEELNRAFLVAVANGTVHPADDLYSFVDEFVSGVESEIENVPESTEKAVALLRSLIGFASDSDQVYEAIILLDPVIPENLVSEIIGLWKEERKIFKSEHEDSPFMFQDEIFWNSLDFREEYDGLSRYRFVDHFKIGGFEASFADVESMMANSLLESAPLPMFTGDNLLTSVAHTLWLVGRSRSMHARIRDAVNLALRRITSQQFADGSWTDYHITEPAGTDPKTGLGLSRYRPCTHTTALCTLNLCKQSVDEHMRESGRRGVRWLLDKQEPDGFWTVEYADNDELKTKPALFATVLALEAIIRSEIEGVQHSIDSGIRWVSQQQDSLGSWDEPGIPYPLMTILVLELISLAETHAKLVSPMLKMAVGMLRQSYELSLVDNPDCIRLAVVAAYHGLEALLYGILSTPTVNISYFESANETIGFRKALTRFQGHLQDKGYIARSDVIHFRNSLDQLAWYRDQIVHKCIEISQTTCRPLVDDAHGFSSEFTLLIFGYDMFA